ncbi:hypothetical protein EsH8_V_000120 [Colletotrichum jinshuiense]
MSRTRSGCLTCKRRHRKCDETRPDCLQCLGQGVECEGYNTVLRWGAGIASRGRFAGASAPVADTPSPKRRRLSGPGRAPGELGSIHGSQSSSPSLPGPAGGSGGGSGRSAPAESGLSGRSPRRLGPGSEPSPTEPIRPSLTEQDRRLFEEFYETTIFMLYSTHRDHSFRTKLRQLAMESEALCSILLATHLYVSSPSRPPPLFEEYYVRGISLFRKQLDGFDGTVNMGVMFAGLFICTLNLFQGSPWSVHLELMTTVYGLCGDLRGSRLVADAEAQFPLELMALMDMPTFVRGRSRLTLGIWARLRSAKSSSPGGGRGGTESISSLPRSLLDIFSAIEDESSEPAFLAWPGDIGEVPHVHLWEAYRLAGVLTGRRLRGGLRGRGAPATPPTEVLLGRLVAAMDALCDTRGRPEYAHLLAANSVLYPYVAARLEVSILLRRPAWMESLRRVAVVCRPYGETANARNIAEMLDDAWNAGDDAYDIDEQARRRNVEVALF